MRKIILAVALSALAATPTLACGPSGGRGIPAIGKSIDAFLPKSGLNSADKGKVTLLRTQIRMLVTDGKTEEARKTEEEAMRILGFEKAWLRCGPGTFTWRKV
jgi:hypothetical protein